MANGVVNVLGALAELVLPRQCGGCGCCASDARPFCRDCGEALVAMVGEAYCLRCGATLPEGFSPAEEGCAHCPEPMPRFDRLIRLGRYDGPLAGAVTAVKFAGQPHPAERLGALLAARVQAEPDLAGVQWVQPVPLHWRRRVGRGYNQARLIARAVARTLDRPLGDALSRVRDTPPQVGLSRRRRRENVRGAFTARPRRIEGLHVLLIDDVTTTGATADEAARALLAAGARRVSLAIVAKADPPPAFTPAHTRE